MTIRDRLPQTLRPLAARDWTAISIGESAASVWRVAGGDSALFLKAEPRHELAQMPGEIQRLDYLADMGFPAPRVVDVVEADDFFWLLMTEVKGRDLTHFGAEPELLCQVLADGLKRLHALDPAHCPFDHGFEAQLRLAKANLDAGLVDESDFDAARLGVSAAAIYTWLQANKPAGGDLVVTHGDACLTNILARDGRFSGVVDVGRLGIADRWQDLALACRSLRDNFGEALVAPFLAAYGAPFDAERFTYFCTLDELF